MGKTKGIQKTDQSTEEKIKAAARIVFLQKGFAATRTRDIADEAGINLALLNYYFRSKAKLFEIIMLETFAGFLQQLALIVNDEKTSLYEKVQCIAERYIDFIIQEPEIPTFLITEVRSNPRELLKRIPIRQTIRQSVFVAQYNEAVEQGEIAATNPLHFLINLIGLVVFPFIAKPMIMAGGNLDTTTFNVLMVQRKQWIPIWMKAMMKTQ